MRMQLRFGMMAAMALGALAANGCSSSEKTPDPTYTYPDQASFCAGLAKAMCSDDFVGACAGSKDNCANNMQKSACQNYGGVVYRPAKADDCVAAYKTAYADGKVTGDEQSNITKTCGIVYGGNGGMGATCTKLTDCDLDEKLECVKGKCEIPEIVAAGEDCSADNKTCKPGYYCTATDKICGKAPVEGGACDEVTKPCAEDFRCVAGTCQAKIKDGDSCDTEAHTSCLSKLCIPVPGAPAGDAGTTPAYRCSSTRVFSAFDPVCIQAATP